MPPRLVVDKRHWIEAMPQRLVGDKRHWIEGDAAPHGGLAGRGAVAAVAPAPSGLAVVRHAVQGAAAAERRQGSV
ncbi:MAG: hypothetical protein GY801_10680 [bacterium]|nr:hypothetical protein [bacterium]